MGIGGMMGIDGTSHQLARQGRWWQPGKRGWHREVCSGRTIGGLRPERDPIIQGQAQAAWLRELIEAGPASASRCARWSCIGAGSSTPWSNCPVWRCGCSNPKGLPGLPGLLAALPQRLNAEDVRLVAYHLSRYARPRR